MKKLIAMLLLVSSPLAFTQELHTFSNGEVADAEKINENFSALLARIDQLEQRIDATRIGLVAHWNFDSCDGTDQSGNGYDAEIFGTPTCVSGAVGAALALSETTPDYLLTSKDLKLSGDSFTLSGWIYIDEFVGDWECVISRQKTDGLGIADSYSLCINANGSVYFWFTDPGQRSVSCCAVSLGTWTHLAVVVDEGVGTVYLNNEQSTTFAINPIVGSDDLRVCLGCNDYTSRDVPDHNFNGNLDDVRVYNRALSQNEIASLFELGSF